MGKPDTVTVPRSRLADKLARAAQRRERLARDYAALASYAAVARKHGMSRQRVWQILNPGADRAD